MKGLSAKSRVSLGLVGIVTSVIMIACYLGIIPDSVTQLRQGRAVLAETIAIYSSALVTKTATARISDDFNLILERNSDLVSIGLRQESGEIFTATGDHENQWQEMSGKYSKNSQLRVPIWAGNKKWGQLELQFLSTSSHLLWGLLDNSMIRIVFFTAILCFVFYYIYLGKVLRQLDPSQAIPGRVRAALDTMAEGLLILDKKEQVVLANRAFANIFDKDSTDLLGLRASEFPWRGKEGTDIDPSERPWIKALREGVVQKDDMMWLQTAQNTLKTFKVNCSPVLGEGNKHAGVLVSFDDVTQLEKKEVELRKSKEEAEQANEAKSAFLANMSHEIRTPMNAILGFTDILKRGYVKNEAESLKYLNTIHSSGKSLLELINDILDLSKVEAGKIEFEMIRFQPYATIHEVVQMLKATAEGKNVALRWQTLKDVPEKIVSDPVRFRQILFNLTGNAVKFTDQGSVDVLCSFSHTTNPPALCIEIKDTGIGMAGEALKNIFDPFVQADESVTRKFGGTGLGLSISRKFARALGGDITVTSQKGQGSVFLLTIPVDNPRSCRFLQPEEVIQLCGTVEKSDTGSWKFSGGKVLIIDDGAENRELVKVVLEDAGLTIEEGENGQIAVDKVLENNYDLVLMDVQMPVMDGFTAAGIMREKGIKIPIIALTANAMKGFEEQCIARGYSAYASKPVDIDKLLQMVSQYLPGNQEEYKHSSKVIQSKISETDHLKPAAESHNIPKETFCFEGPVVSRLQSHPKLGKVIARFADKLHHETEKLNHALDKQNYLEIAERAHWLKGAAGTVGFDDFTEPATLLEEAAKSSDLQKMSIQIQHIKALHQAIVLPADSGDIVVHPDTTFTEQNNLYQVRVEADKQEQAVISRLANHPKLKNTILKFIDKVDSEIGAMKNAAADGRFDELALLAHWLKGAAGTVGYDDFTEPAIELEILAQKGNSEALASQLQKLEIMVQNIVPPL